MAEDLAGAGVVRGLGILGSAGQLGAVFFGGDLSGDVIRHLVEGLEAHRRHGQRGGGDGCQTVRPDGGFKRAANLDLFAEDIGDGVAVFLLGETAHTHDVGILSRRRRRGNRSAGNRQDQG